SLAAWTVTPEDPIGAVAIWKAKQRYPTFTTPLVSSNRNFALKFSPAGGFVTFKDNGLLRVIETTAGTEWPVPKTLQAGGEIAFHPNEKLLAMGAGAKIRLFDKEGRAFGAEQAVDGTIRHLAFSHDGASILVSQSDDLISPKPAVVLK